MEVKRKGNDILCISIQLLDNFEVIPCCKKFNEIKAMLAIHHAVWRGTNAKYSVIFNPTFNQIIETLEFLGNLASDIFPLAFIARGCKERKRHKQRRKQHQESNVMQRTTEARFWKVRNGRKWESRKRELEAASQREWRFPWQCDSDEWTQRRGRGWIERKATEVEVVQFKWWAFWKRLRLSRNEERKGSWEQRGDRNSDSNCVVFADFDF